jgi:hypothetical protein
MYFPATFGTFHNSGGPMALACGAVTGPDMLITLITNEGATAPIRSELFEWYANTPLPTTDWDDLFPDFPNTVAAVSESAACLIARSNWEYEYLLQKQPSDPRDDTRCEKVHGDCVKKAVQLLNTWRTTGVKPAAWAPDANYEACYTCHTVTLGPRTDPKLGYVKNGREDCTICHDVSETHHLIPPKELKGKKK